MKQVFILTYCRVPELLYGTTLIFETLRVGFPHAEVTVVDNNSIAAVRPLIRELAEQHACAYHQLNAHEATSHANFIRRTVLGPLSGTVIFLDPDLIFWQSCEDWAWDKLIAGRLIPKFRDEYSGCITMPRLHTSFLWIEDVGRLRLRIQTIKSQFFDFSPFSPYAFTDGTDWYRFDTGASLYAAIREDAYCFGARELNAYDHLFVGSHLDMVLDKLAADDRAALLRSHELARQDYKQLKGMWRAQDEFFRQRLVR